LHPDGDPPPPNVHGDKVFLIKFQVQISSIQPNGALGPPLDNMMLYDRQRTIEAYLVRKTSPSDFDAFLAEMRGLRKGYGGVKVRNSCTYLALAQYLQMYRYARRVGDHELSVCLDREPKETIKW
jgi:hypothetical protein